MKTIRIIRPTFLGGRPLAVGDVVEVSTLDAGILLANGKAETVREVAALEPRTETAALSRKMPNAKRRVPNG